MTVISIGLYHYIEQAAQKICLMLMLFLSLHVRRYINLTNVITVYEGPLDRYSEESPFYEIVT